MITQVIEGIALKLKQEGIKFRPTKKGVKKDFTLDTLSRMLKNSIYYGLLEVKAGDEIVVFETPPLISKTEWDRLQERTMLNKFKSKEVGFAESYFLRDITVCGKCGGKAKAVRGNERNDHTYPRYYRCYWEAASNKRLQITGKQRCELPLVKGDEI